MRGCISRMARCCQAPPSRQPEGRLRSRLPSAQSSCIHLWTLATEVQRAGRHNAEGKCSIDSCRAAERLTFDHRRSKSQGKSTAMDQVAIYPPAASEIRRPGRPHLSAIHACTRRTHLSTRTIAGSTRCCRRGARSGDAARDAWGRVGSAR
jgi:hypothetical protein